MSHTFAAMRTCRSKANSQVAVMYSSPGCTRGARGLRAAAPRLVLVRLSDPGCVPRASAAGLSPIIAANACTTAACLTAMLVAVPLLCGTLALRLSCFDAMPMLGLVGAQMTGINYKKHPPNEVCKVIRCTEGAAQYVVGYRTRLD